MDDDVQVVDDGLYVVREGDTPSLIASRLYSNPLHARTLLDANPTSEFKVGEQIVVPHKKGRITKWMTTANGEWPAESEEALIKRMFHNQPVHIFIKLFNLWNNEGDIEPGATVFVPER